MCTSGTRAGGRRLSPSSPVTSASSSNVAAPCASAREATGPGPRRAVSLMACSRRGTKAAGFLTTSCCHCGGHRHPGRRDRRLVPERRQPGSSQVLPAQGARHRPRQHRSPGLRPRRASPARSFRQISSRCSARGIASRYRCFQRPALAQAAISGPRTGPYCQDVGAAFGQQPFDLLLGRVGEQADPQPLPLGGGQGVEPGHQRGDLSR
jgi:hypothetical protein